MLQVLLWVGGLIILLGLLFFAFWKLWFLRQPARAISAKQDVVSPADGTVVRIIPYKNGASASVPKGLLGTVKTLTRDVAKQGNIVVIMLTPLDVHYQRAPVSGTVRSVAYSKGRFANAVFGASRLAAFENEKNEILIDTGKMRVKVVQVAGILARRISCSVRSGQKVQKGDVIGLINLGSQVLLVLPDIPLKVTQGQKVIDGETVIA